MHFRKLISIISIHINAPGARNARRKPARESVLRNWRYHSGTNAWNQQPTLFVNLQKSNKKPPPSHQVLIISLRSTSTTIGIPALWTPDAGNNRFYPFRLVLVDKRADADR